MAADSITIGFTSASGDIYSLILSDFLDEEIPRRILGEAELERSVLGMNYSAGPSVKHRNLWVINVALKNKVTANATKNAVNYNEVTLLKEMYDAWDTDRANGLVSRVSISDEILEPVAPLTTNGWFTEPPTFAVIGNYGSNLLNAVFSLTEV